MDIDLLQSFLTLARLGTFTRAAEELYITQPTLSRRIAALEKEMGCRLVERGRSGIVLTAAGERLQTEAEAIVGRIEALPRIVRGACETGGEPGAAARPEPRGLLRIAAQEMIDDSFVSAFVGHMASVWPKIDVHLLRAYPPKIRHALERGQVDVAFFLRPAISSTSPLPTCKIGESRVQLIVCDSHPFARRKQVDVHELVGEAVIMLNREVSPEVVDFINARCFSAGFSLNAVRYVDDIENGIILVSAGKGVSFVHSMMKLGDTLPAAGVRAIELTGADFSIDYVARIRPDLPDALSAAALESLSACRA